MQLKVGAASSDTFDNGAYIQCVDAECGALEDVD